MANSLLGVLSALPEELVHLSDRSGDQTEIGGLPFWRGQIAGREAVFVETGPGKVNGGVATALLLDRFDCRALMLCGVAGGLDPALGVGDIVIGTNNLQHDFGLDRESGFVTIQPGSRPSRGEDWAPGYPLDEALVTRLRDALAGVELEPLPQTIGAGRRVPDIHFGPILTGDSFVNSETTRRRLRERFADARAVEMEGGAVAQIARRWGADIPFVNVRCLSDLAGSDSHLDFRALLPVAARYASLVAHRLAPVI
ncbi:5'-methylthioadenosine/S-adenosylhomocysteine nucleosidase [Reyranella sp.]|uniref:5'-methylthioadenosine/S-adenosylhomocysteine nucleosidase n=1 Tax=Reyranella sp. TaxID=1929291 RepID=UPI003784C95E